MNSDRKSGHGGGDAIYWCQRDARLRVRSVVVEREKEGKGNCTAWRRNGTETATM